MRSRKGSAWVWLVVTILMFIIGAAWVIENEIMNGYFFPIFNEHAAEYPAGALAAQNQVETTWNWWPIIAIFGVILWGVVRTLKEEPQTANYGG